MKKLYDLFCVLVVFTALIISLVIPKEISASAYGLITLCVTKVVPSIFFFVFLSNILSRSGVAFSAGNALSFIITPLFGIPKKLCGAFIIGITGGFPGGAISCGIAYSKGLCTKKEASYCTAISNGCSIPFIFTVIGLQLIEGKKYAYILLLSQIICIFITALLLRFAYRIKPDISTVENDCCKIKQSFFEIICDGVKQSCNSVLNICGFITVFGIVSALISSVTNADSSIKAILKGIFEITGGVEMLKDTDFPKNIILCSLLMGFSGMSAIFQVCSVCSEYGLSHRLFILSRLFCAVLMPVTASLLLIILSKNKVFDLIDNISSFIKANSYPVLILYALFLLFVMCSMVLIYQKLRINANKRLKMQKK